MDRRLAAILVADVVGFSRLMAADETGTIAALRQRRAEVLEPVLKDHRGRIVKLMGDGVLVEFASAVNAVAAAIELQKRMAEANEGLPEDRHVVLRIGLNLGDVVGAGSDIYGDGVNIAARLEALAEPGGVCVSGKVYQEVLGKTTALFVDMGEQSLKNIAAPVRAYRLRSGLRPSTASSSPSLASPVKQDTSRPSVAVLPFDNMSGDPDQEYFSDGITEDIITAISRFRSLFVIARNSSFAFRGQQLTIPEIAKQLGVDYVVEGSVRRAGSRVRITAQLIEAASGNHVWSERFDRSLEDIFAVQEEVASVIATTIDGKVLTDVANKAKVKSPERLLAYDLVLRGFYLQQQQSRASVENSIELLKQAIAIAPNYGEAHTILALSLTELWLLDLDHAALRMAVECAKTGVSLELDNARCQIIAGLCTMLTKQFEQSYLHHVRATALNPNDPHVASHMGGLLTYMGQPSKSADWQQRALLLNPFPPSWYRAYMGVTAYCLQRYSDCSGHFSTPDDYVVYRMYLAASLGQLGRTREASAVLDECVRLKPDIPVIKFAEAEPYKNPADTEHLIDGLKKAGLEV